MDRFPCIIAGTVSVPSHSVKYFAFLGMWVTSTLVGCMVNDLIDYVTFLSVVLVVTRVAFRLFRLWFCGLPRLTSGRYSRLVRCCCAFFVALSIIDRDLLVAIAFKVQVVPAAGDWWFDGEFAVCHWSGYFVDCLR